MNGYTLYLNFAEAKAGTGTYEFNYDVYKSVDSATAGWAANLGSDLFTPMRAIKNSGYYRLEFMGSSTSMYVSAANPTVVSTSQPT